MAVAAGHAGRLKAYVTRNDGERYARFLACRREDGAVVGFFNLGEIIRGPLQTAFLGYGAFVPHDGRGYMSEGMALVLHEAFVAQGLHRVEANIQPGNIASIALARRSGFTREGFSPGYLHVAGRWRDHERWAIRAEVWGERREASRRAG